MKEIRIEGKKAFLVDGDLLEAILAQAQRIPPEDSRYREAREFVRSTRAMWELKEEGDVVILFPDSAPEHYSIGLVDKSDCWKIEGLT
jgi:hypothetical protein